MATSTEDHCAHCHKRTRKHCSRCVLPRHARDKPLPLTFYCSTKCQKTDYASHKHTCYARQQLFRGAWLLKQAFLMFREVMFEMEITDVKVVAGELHFYEPAGSDAADKASPLYRFPRHLLSTDEDREALLTYCACEDALKYMFELTGKVLHGITSRWQPPMEVSFFTAESDLKVYRYSGGVAMERSSAHTFLVLCLNNAEREKYAIDLAGAQYHQYDAVLPLEVYDPSNKRLGEAFARRPFGHEAQCDLYQDAIKRARSNAAKGKPVHHGTAIFGIEADMAEILNGAVKMWEQNSNLTVTEMLRKHEKDFELASGGLLLLIKTTLQLRIKELRSDIPFEKFIITNLKGSASIHRQSPKSSDSEIATIAESIDKGLTIQAGDEEGDLHKDSGHASVERVDDERSCLKASV